MMEALYVAIEIDGEMSTGKLVDGEAEVGKTVTIELHDENGMPAEQTGVVIEVL